jgi:hypothetical protein
MNNVINIQIAVEDSLSEQVLRKILRESAMSYEVVACYGKRGKDYLKEKINGFNNASKGLPFFLLTDLDQCECPPAKIHHWLPHNRNSNFLFRIAVREVEAWLLSHRSAFALFAGIPEKSIDRNPEAIPNPKEYLIRLVTKSRKRDIREAIVPRTGSTAKIGPNYNVVLGEFVWKQWDVHEAIKNSPSLEGAFNAVSRFRSVE